MKLTTVPPKAVRCRRFLGSRKCVGLALADAALQVWKACIVRCCSLTSEEGKRSVDGGVLAGCLAFWSWAAEETSAVLRFGQLTIDGGNAGSMCVLR